MKLRNSKQAEDYKNYNFWTEVSEVLKEQQKNELDFAKDRIDSVKKQNSQYYKITLEQDQLDHN